MDTTHIGSNARGDSSEKDLISGGRTDRALLTALWRFRLGDRGFEDNYDVKVMGLKPNGPDLFKLMSISQSQAEFKEIHNLNLWWMWASRDGIGIMGKDTNFIG